MNLDPIPDLVVRAAARLIGDPGMYTPGEGRSSAMLAVAGRRTWITRIVGGEIVIAPAPRDGLVSVVEMIGVLDEAEALDWDEDLSAAQRRVLDHALSARMRADAQRAGITSQLAVA